MKKVPNIISSKDLSYIEDMFNWHFTICKKAYSYSECVVDETIQKFMKDVAKKHEKICNKLIKLVGSDN